jgi:hypothetical protein
MSEKDKAKLREAFEVMLANVEHPVRPQVGRVEFISDDRQAVLTLKLLPFPEPLPFWNVP